MTVLLAAFGIILSVCSTWIFIYNIFMCRGKLRRIVTLVNITIIMLFAVMLIANAAVKSSDKEYCTTGSVTQNTKYEATKNGYHRFVHNYIIDSEYIAVPDNLPLPRLVKIYPYVKIYEAKGCSGNNAISLEGTTYTLYSQAEIISPDIRPATTVFGVCLYAALIIFNYVVFTSMTSNSINYPSQTKEGGCP